MRKSKEQEQMEKEEEEQNRQIENQIKVFNSNIVPYGYLDIKTACTIALSIGEGGDWVAEQVDNYIDNTDIKKDDVDVVYCVYDSILQECRQEIENHTKKDIQKDLSHVIEVAGNFMCTSFDGNAEAVKETLELAYRVPETERSKKLNWFIDQLKQMY